MNLIISKKFKNRNSNNFFIGSWCLNKKNFYENEFQNHNVAPYHWDNKRKLDKDLNYLLKLHDQYLKLLKEKLNKHHNLRFTKKFYTIILTRWLWKFLVFYYDRWEQINLIKKNKQITSCTVNEYNNIKFIPISTRHFCTNLILQNDWNEWVFSEIIKEKKFLKCRKIKKKIRFQQGVLESKNNFSLIILINNFLSFFSSKKFVSQNIILPKISKILFSIFNKQFMFSYQTDLENLIQNENKIDLSTRKKIFCNNSKNSDFVNFINKQIIYNFPKIFLENFKDNLNFITKLNLPKKPKLILTSLDHHFNDTFNLYAALSREVGSKYYIFQHGGSYGLADNFIAEKLDIKISDKFFTWGWKDKSNKVVPFFFQKFNSIKKNIFSKKKKSGIVIPTTEFKLEPGDIAGGRPRHCNQVNDYINNINYIISNLNNEIKKDVTIKYLETRNISYVKDSIFHKFPNLNFLCSKKNTYSHNFRLSIETLNSTGFLDAMFLNHPVLLLLDKNYSPIRSNAKNIINNLKKAKIVHNSSNSISGFLNSNYSDINKWWNSKKVQDSRKIFCNNYLRSSKSLIFDINEL